MIHIYSKNKFFLKFLYQVLINRGFYNFYLELKDYIYFDIFLRCDVYERYYKNSNYVPSFSSYLKLGIKKIKSYLTKKNLLFKVNESLLIDIGSGKGKILILASFIGFKESIGIEKNVYLYKQCIKNIKKLKSTFGKCKNVKIYNQVANKFTLVDKLKNIGQGGGYKV